MKGPPVTAQQAGVRDRGAADARALDLTLAVLQELARGERMEARLERVDARLLLMLLDSLRNQLRAAQQESKEARTRATVLEQYRLTARGLRTLKEEAARLAAELAAFAGGDG